MASPSEVNSKMSDHSPPRFHESGGSTSANSNGRSVFRVSPKKLCERLTLLDYGLPGKIFRGAKPQSVSEIQKLKDKKITHIVSFLSADWERVFHDKKASIRTAIEDIYEQNGFTLIKFPIADFETPNEEQLKSLIDQILKIAAFKENTILMHCYSGRGRTGLVAACIAKVLGLSGEKAVEWIREKVPRAIDILEQANFVRNFNSKSADPEGRAGKEESPRSPRAAFRKLGF